VTEGTVRTAHKESIAQDYAVDKRVGLDGKIRMLPTRQEPEYEEPGIEDKIDGECPFLNPVSSAIPCASLMQNILHPLCVYTEMQANSKAWRAKSTCASVVAGVSCANG